MTSVQSHESKLLYRWSSGRVAITSTIVFVLFTATVLPWQQKRTDEFANGASSPDSSFFYSAGDMYAAALAFGADGRQDYVIARVTFDVIWPLVYAIFLSTALSWLLARLIAQGSRWRLLNLLPWIALVLDYLENFASVVVIGRYPSETPILADIATYFTMSKWLVLSAGFVVLALAGVMVVVNRVRRRPAVASA